MKVLALLLCFLCLFAAISSVNAQPVWQANLDGKVRFYQTTDFGILLAGSDNSLYALDGQTGERLWRRKHKGLDETSITPIPATDLILVSLDEGSKSRVEAVDLMSGNSLWRSDKVKGDVMQLAVEPEQDLLAAVLVKKARGRVGEEFKRSPVVHVLRLSDGEELWKKELDSDVQMMPSSFAENSEVAYTLDNYRPPLTLDGRLYLFYEGVTSYDARTGKTGERETFKINEGGLALTEADPVFNEKYLFTSGKGKIRAINRQNFKVEWEANDLGVTPEMAIVGDVLYVRTGGQFTRIKDGETEEKGSFGVSAIDTKNGKTLWRFKDADKGLTNFVFADVGTILIADKNELIMLDARTGKRREKFKHDVERAQFVLINEKGEAVVGGRDEIAAFTISDLGSRNADLKNQPVKRNEFTKVNFQSEIQNPKSKIQNREVWRVKHKAPSRGVFRTIAGIALRATALYFRYGGLATSALNIARGANLARSVLGFRWSGLRNHFSSLNLTTLASNSAKNYVSNRIFAYGSIARTPNLLSRVGSGLQIELPTVSGIRGKVINSAARSIAPSRADVQESVLDRLDPVRRVEKLSSYLLRRKRLADLRGNYMYFYTDLPRPFDRKGLVGVNVHTGRDARFILVSEPDTRFTTDETVGLLYSADGSRLQAFDVMDR
jgi:outer membrane protein assembly factor BamB